MGMFDDPEKFTDHFQEGDVFYLLAAKVGNELQTIHGPGRPVLLKIRTDQGPKWFSVFGEGLLNQVERMDPGDLPADVKIDRVDTKGGQRVKLLVPASA